MNKNISTNWALLFSCLLLFSTSCVKEDDITTSKDYPEFIVFGTFFSPNACSGNETCIELYKADAMGLKEDVNDTEPDGISSYSGTYSNQLSVNSYQTVMDLFEANPIPEELLEMPNGEVGNQNQFGQNFYLEYKTEAGGYQYWVLGGAFDGSMPQAIQNYLNVISNATFFASQG
ncbi:MAG: hypothetical protein ACKVOK_03315 [Flavobacteriales bacterium]